MKTRTRNRLLVASAAVFLSALAPSIASAHTRVVFGINLGGLLAPPAVVYSPPAYYRPAPNYYRPRVIYRSPGFVYYRHSTGGWGWGHRSWQQRSTWHRARGWNHHSRHASHRGHWRH